MSTSNVFTGLAILLLVSGLLAACARPTPVPPTAAAAPETTPLAPEAEDSAAKAQEDLGQRLNAGADSITIVSAEAHTWGDASLGLPEPGKVYAQMLTSGYIVTLYASGKTYVYHVAGSNVRLDAAQSAPLPKK
jgi:hypothetical protein